MQAKNVVGIDLGKSTYEAVRIDGTEKLHRMSGKTDERSRKQLYSWLAKDDIVALEAGNLAFLYAKEIRREVGAEVIVLNPGDLHVIFKSLKKTDKQDCLNIARFVKRHPADELPVVRVPDDYEEAARFLISEEEYWSSGKTRAVNRLHSVIAMTGVTGATKKDLKSRSRRQAIIDALPAAVRETALRIELEITQAESNLRIISVEIRKQLSARKEDAEIILSLPGIGPITALTFLAYVGDGSRFSNAKQVAYYAGLVPRVDNSGATKKECGLVRRGCRQLKRVMIQCAWALLRSRFGGELKEKYEALRLRKGKGKAIVAIARKMLELIYTLLTKRDKYRHMPQEELNRKMALYRVA